MANLRHQLRQAALAEGFDAVGFAEAALSDKIGENLQAFLAAGWHGDMGWLENRANERAQPQKLWPDAKTIMMVGHNYAPDFDPEMRLKQKDQAVISVYAQNRDYHDVMKRKLRQLAGFSAKLLSCDVKIFVDTAPVMEKPLAVQAGLGWQGKHTKFGLAAIWGLIYFWARFFWRLMCRMIIKLVRGRPHARQSGRAIPRMNHHKTSPMPIIAGPVRPV